MVVNLGLHYGSLGPKPKQMTLDGKKLVHGLYMDDYGWKKYLNEIVALWKDVDREFYCSCRWRNRSQPFIFSRLRVRVRVWRWRLCREEGDEERGFHKHARTQIGVLFLFAVIASRLIGKLRSASARSWEKPTRSFTMRAKVWLPLLLPICCFLPVSLLLSSSVWKLWDRVPHGRRVFEVCVWCVWFDKIDLRFLLALCGSIFFFCFWVAFSAERRFGPLLVCTSIGVHDWLLL